VRGLLDRYDDGALQRLMTDLGGHDMETVLDAFHAIKDDGLPASSPTLSRVTVCRWPAIRTTTRVS